MYTFHTNSTYNSECVRGIKQSDDNTKTRSGSRILFKSDWHASIIYKASYMYM